MKEVKKGEIIIYKSPDGPELKVKLEGEMVWATQAQIAELFGTQRPAITKHLRNIFKSAELSEKSVCSILEHTGPDGKIYKVQYYNLDAIIAVGYRVNSKKATQFRIWATEKIKELVLKGYAVDKQRLLQLEGERAKIRELEQVNKLFLQVIEARRAEGYEKELLSLITDYTNTWFVLNQYDQGNLQLEQVTSRKARSLDYDDLTKSIAKFRERLKKLRQASDLFGQEVGGKFQGALAAIDQTYGGKDVYRSIEEKAAHLLYFIIKDHPFADGNKRIGSLTFLLYLLHNNILMSKRGERKINDSALAALALLIAESKPQDKDAMVRLIVNLINRR